MTITVKTPAENTDPARAANGEKKDTAFKRWYDKNKGQVAKRRKARYASDPDYRERVKELAKNAKIVLLTWDDVAGRLEVKASELKRQCEVGLFPNPIMREGIEVFTMPQFEYLKTLQALIRKFGRHSQEVGNHASLTYANWS
jgi:hypothetical protein